MSHLVIVELSTGEEKRLLINERETFSETSIYHWLSINRWQWHVARRPSGDLRVLLEGGEFALRCNSVMQPTAEPVGSLEFVGISHTPMGLFENRLNNVTGGERVLGADGNGDTLLNSALKVHQIFAKAEIIQG